MKIIDLGWLKGQ